MPCSGHGGFRRTARLARRGQPRRRSARGRISAARRPPGADIPVNSLCIDPVTPTTFYVGTDIGVFGRSTRRPLAAVQRQLAQ
jgi:hypothetical protein